MGNVNVDGIWTPDEEDTLEPDVWSQQMGESISQGLGLRVKKQETRAGLRATIRNTFDLTGYMTLPITVNKSFRYSELNFIQNLELTQGVIKIKTSGLYFISGSLTMTFGVAGVPIDFSIGVNGQVLSVTPFETSATSWTGGTLTNIVYLTAGDTVYLRAGIGAERGDTVGVEAVYANMAMLYAT